MEMFGALNGEQATKLVFALLMIYPMLHAVRFTLFMILPISWVKMFFTR